MKKWSCLLVSLLMLIGLVLPGSVALAADYVVTVKKPNGDPIGEGSYDGLAGAIAAAASDPEPNPKFTLLKSFEVGRLIEMTKGSLDMNGCTLTIKNNVTFQNVKDIYGGSFIVTNGYTLTLDNVIVRDCIKPDRYSQGGAIYAQDGARVVVKNSTFNHNEAWEGGAIFLNGKSSRLTVENSTFIANAADYNTEQQANNWGGGGAIYLFNGQGDIRNCMFENNTSGWAAGAIMVHKPDAKLYLYGSTFTGNSARQYGGAVMVCEGRAEIMDLNGNATIFDGNKVTDAADFGGGGLFIDRGYVWMEDALITNNSARDAGGGLSTCTTGTAEVGALHGAAIYANTVTDKAALRVDPEIYQYQDVFFHTKDHIDHNNNSIIPGRDGFKTEGMKYALYERMFNGSLHNWKGKTIESTATTFDGVSRKLYSYIAQSNPDASSRTETGAKVIFKNNVVDSTSSTGIVSGGGIADNGLLEIGTKAKKTEIKIVKAWQDTHNKSNRLTEEQLLGKIKLYQDGSLLGTLAALKANPDIAITVLTGTEATSTIPYSDIVLTDDSSVQSVYDSEQRTWKTIPNTEYWLIIVSGLEMGKTYMIQEDEIPNYTSKVDGKVIFNAPLRDIEFTKVWEVSDSVAHPSSITIHLHADGEIIATKELTESDNWFWKFEGLPVYDEDAEIAYTITEDSMHDFTHHNTEAVHNVEKIAITITNKYHQGYTAIDVSKKWEDHHDRDGKRPASVIIQLLADGQPVPDRILTLTSENEWFGEFENLPEKTNDGKPIVYTVQEIEVPFFVSTVEGDSTIGFTITNHEVLSIPVRKEWKDEQNRDQSRPAQITVHLLADGKDTGKTLTLNEANQWQGSFDKLYVWNAAGERIVYTIAEDSVPGYTSSISGNAAQGFTLVNSHKPDLYRFTFRKIWSGGSEADIAWTLYSADGKPMNATFSKKVISDTEWEYEAWLSGDPDAYLIERSMPGYSIRYENVGTHAYDEDRLYNGGKLVNIQIPKTGDNQRPILGAVVAVGSVLVLAGVAVVGKRRRKP